EVKRSGSEEGDDVTAAAASGGDGRGVDDRFEFDPNQCSVTHGKWVFNASIKPLYSDKTCPYIDRQFSCVQNGSPLESQTRRSGIA
ncbi:hypothetical protein U1Q18_035566, partial [Sarracenia purpurea var. burkii]